jgi:ferredoxin/flavodoxin---NADP+ reductase
LPTPYGLIRAGVALDHQRTKSVVDGVAWDSAAGIVPNVAGRVVDEERTPVRGVYVTGWIKRGPHGLIGTNRTCAEQTVASLLADFDDGLLDRTVGSREDLLHVMTDRGAEPVTWTGWRAIDTAERQLGASESRARVKFVEIDAMLAAVRGT